MVPRDGDFDGRTLLSDWSKKTSDESQSGRAADCDFIDASARNPCKQAFFA
jgi:hypothetical protein